MVVYYYYIDSQMHKFKPIKVFNRSILGFGKGIRAILDPKDDFRKDKSKTWIDLAEEEGKVRYCSFWLEEEDDERAEQIWENYKRIKIEQLQKQIDKLKVES